MFLDVVRGLCEVVFTNEYFSWCNQLFFWGDYSPFVVKFMRVFTMFWWFIFFFLASMTSFLIWQNLLRCLWLILISVAKLRQVNPFFTLWIFQWQQLIDICTTKQGLELRIPPLQRQILMCEWGKPHSKKRLCPMLYERPISRLKTPHTHTHTHTKFGPNN